MMPEDISSVSKQTSSQTSKTPQKGSAHGFTATTGVAKRGDLSALLATLKTQNEQLSKDMTKLVFNKQLSPEEIQSRKEKIQEQKMELGKQILDVESKLKSLDEPLPAAAHKTSTQDLATTREKLKPEAKEFAQEMKVMTGNEGEKIQQKQSEPRVQPQNPSASGTTDTPFNAPTQEMKQLFQKRLQEKLKDLKEKDPGTYKLLTSLDYHMYKMVGTQYSRSQVETIRDKLNNAKPDKEKSVVVIFHEKWTKTGVEQPLEEDGFKTVINVAIDEGKITETTIKACDPKYQKLKNMF